MQRMSTGVRGIAVGVAVEVVVSLAAHSDCAYEANNKICMSTSDGGKERKRVS